MLFIRAEVGTVLVRFPLIFCSLPSIFPSSRVTNQSTGNPVVRLQADKTDSNGGVGWAGAGVILEILSHWILLVVVGRR